MSSHTYSTELNPDPALRWLVMLSGVAATVVGLLTITLLSLPLVWRTLAALAWLLLNGRELLLIAKGYKRCRRIRIEHDGAAELLGPDGNWTAATLVAGSIVVRRVAWLRLETQDGRRFAELICYKYAQNEEWRRLQVIWRHLGAGR